MIEDKEQFILLKTIKGIKENVDKMYTLGNDDLQFMRDEFLGYLRHDYCYPDKLSNGCRNLPYCKVFVGRSLQCLVVVQKK